MPDDPIKRALGGGSGGDDPKRKRLPTGLGVDPSRHRAQADATAMRVGPRPDRPTYTLAESWQLLGAAANNPSTPEELVGSIATGFIPIAGEAQDLAALQDAAERGDVPDALMAGTALVTPFVAAPLIKAGARVLKKPIEYALGIAATATAPTRHAAKRLWTRYLEGYWLPRSAEGLEAAQESIIEALVGQQIRYETELTSWIDNPVGPMPQPPTRDVIYDALLEDQRLTHQSGRLFLTDQSSVDIFADIPTEAFAEQLELAANAVYVDVPEGLPYIWRNQKENLDELLANAPEDMDPEELRILIEKRDLVEQQLEIIEGMGPRAQIPDQWLSGGRGEDTYVDAWRARTESPMPTPIPREVENKIFKALVGETTERLGYKEMFFSGEIAEALLGDISIAKGRAEAALGRAASKVRDAPPGSRARAAAEEAHRQAMEDLSVIESLSTRNRYELQGLVNREVSRAQDEAIAARRAQREAERAEWRAAQAERRGLSLTEWEERVKRPRGGG